MQRKYILSVAVLMLTACGQVDPQGRGVMNTYACALGGCKKALANKQEHVKQVQADNSNLKEQATQKQKKQAELAKQRTSLEVQYAALSDDIQKLKNTLQKSHQSTSPQAKELDELENEVTLRQQGGASQAELDALKKRKDSLEKQIKKLLGS